MRVVRAEVLGLCFGVRDALKRLEQIDRPSEATIHGHLVHNEIVVEGLKDRGFPTESETERDGVPDTPVVVITAHGVSDKRRQQFEAAGKEVVDTTCPLVTRAHQAAIKLRDGGYHVLVIGRKGHVEVQGLTEDLTSFDVVSSETEVRRYPHARIGIICQTTTTEAAAGRIHEAILDRNPDAEIRFIDTICLPTKEHQRALARLFGRVDGVVVVGGQTSNNTKELVRLCEQNGVRAWHVQSADDLQPDWFLGIRSVGLTAGTSTLDETIDDVQSTLERIGAMVYA